MDFWSQFEGQLLDGQFKLNKYSGQDGVCAVFLSELPGQDQFVAAKIVRVASLQAERLISSWKSAKDLEHPNLTRVYATGAADLDGLRIAYAVTDYPDATLAGVIHDRCLGAEEARELLAGCAEALQYMHQKGFVHAGVQPANIVAVDEATKLSSDSLGRAAERKKPPAKLDRYDAPEVEKTGYSTATDVWSLGLTLFEAMKQGLPAGNTDPDIRSLPAPFAEIVGRCLDPKPASRWTAGQILSFLQSGSSAQAAVAAKPEPAPTRVTASSSRAAPASLIKPALPLAPTSRARRGLAVRNSVLLRYAFSAVVILFCLAWLAKTSVQPDRPVTGTVQPVEQPSIDRPRPAVPIPAVPMEEPKPQQTPTTPRVAAANSGSADRVRSIWRVVLYTYSSAQNAQAQAADIGRKSPQLKAQVLSLKSEPSHMVVVGGKMNRDEASKLRLKLLAEGFPKDTYIQNFPE